MSTVAKETRTPSGGGARPGPRSTRRVVWDLLAPRVPSGRILDIPCGQGAFTRQLVNARYDVRAADLQDQPGPPRGRFQVLDMNEPLPFPPGTFDAVVSMEGIEHIRRPFDFIRECHRILRPGGYLFITTPNISSLRSRWRWFLTGFHNKCKYPLDESQPALRQHIAMRSFPEMRYLLRTSGLRIEHIATNRIKPINWFYIPWAPVQALATALELRHGAKTEAHRRQTAEIRRQMLSLPVLLGESLSFVARTPPS